MEAEARYTVVGAAVILLVSSLVMVVLWMKNFSQQDDFAFYTINFENQRIDGLQVDGDVDIRGVRVGRVVSFELADYMDNGAVVNRVSVVVSIEKTAPIFTSTVAVITRNLVTGIAQISLVTPNSAGAMPLEVSGDGTYPIIAEGRSDLDEIAGKVELLSEMAGEVMANVNRVLSAENREAFSLLMNNLNTLTGNLNQRMEELDEVLAGLSQASASVDDAGTRVSSLAANAESEFGTLVEDARFTLEEARLAMENVSGTMLALEAQGATLTSQVDRTGAVLSDQVAAAVSELRLTLESAEVTLQRLQDPRGAVLGVTPSQLGPGE